MSSRLPHRAPSRRPVTRSPFSPSKPRASRRGRLPRGAARVVPGDLEGPVTAAAAHGGGVAFKLRALATVGANGVDRSPGRGETGRVLGPGDDGPAQRRLRRELQLSPRHRERLSSDVEYDLAGRQLQDAVPGAFAKGALHVRFQTSPLERCRHGATTSLAGTPLRWRLVREPSIHALDRLALETRPRLARADPGPLAGPIQAAGVLVLQPLDQPGRRVVRGDAVLFSQPLAVPQRPATHVRHEPQPDREVDVDVQAAREPGGAAALFGVAQEPAAERQVPITRAGNPEVLGLAPKALTA